MNKITQPSAANKTPSRTPEKTVSPAQRDGSSKQGTAAVAPTQAPHRRSPTQPRGATVDVTVPDATLASYSSVFSALRASEAAKSSSDYASMTSSLMAAVASRSSARLTMRAGRPTTTVSANDPGATGKVAFARAPYCQMYASSADEPSALTGELLPQWSFKAMQYGLDTDLYAFFTQAPAPNKALQSKLTSNGTYLSDLASEQCLVSLAETYADPWGASLRGREYMPQMKNVASTSSAEYSVFLNVTGYRCGEEEPAVTRYPFYVPTFSDKAFDDVFVMPDFQAETQCSTPIATQTFYFPFVSLGVYNENGLLARDALMQATVSTDVQTQTATQTIVPTSAPFAGPSSLAAPLNLLALPQRVESSAFGAINTLLFGTAATVMLLARRKLQRQSDTSRV